MPDYLDVLARDAKVTLAEGYYETANKSSAGMMKRRPRMSQGYYQDGFMEWASI